jgi:hypothetical protein
MVEAQCAKYVLALPPISVAGGATATDTEVDTKGFDYAEFIIMSGLVGANGVSEITIQESDTSGSGEANITDATFTDLVDADDNKILCCFLDLRKRKRYLSLVLTNGATNASVMAALVRLSRAEEAPNTAAERGLLQQLIP